MRPLIECDHCLSSSTFAIFLILPAATTNQLITTRLTLSHNKTRKFYYIKTVNLPNYLSMRCYKVSLVQGAYGLHSQMRKECQFHDREKTEH